MAKGENLTACLGSTSRRA